MALRVCGLSALASSMRSARCFLDRAPCGLSRPKTARMDSFILTDISHMPAPERRRYAVPTRKPRLRGLEPATDAAQNRPFALAARVEPFSNGFRPIMDAPLLPSSCCRSSLSMLMPGAAAALAAAGQSAAGSPFSTGYKLRSFMCCIENRGPCSVGRHLAWSSDCQPV
jgi:hypothetical protein